jgi:hypothetical protein
MPVHGPRRVCLLRAAVHGSVVTPSKRRIPRRWDSRRNVEIVALELPRRETPEMHVRVSPAGSIAVWGELQLESQLVLPHRVIT